MAHIRNDPLTGETPTRLMRELGRSTVLLWCHSHTPTKSDLKDRMATAVIIGKAKDSGGHYLALTSKEMVVGITPMPGFSEEWPGRAQRQVKEKSTGGEIEVKVLHGVFRVLRLSTVESWALVIIKDYKIPERYAIRPLSQGNPAPGMQYWRTYQRDERSCDAYVEKSGDTAKWYGQEGSDFDTPVGFISYWDCYKEKYKRMNFTLLILHEVFGFEIDPICGKGSPIMGLNGDIVALAMEVAAGNADPLRCLAMPIELFVTEVNWRNDLADDYPIELLLHPPAQRTPAQQAP